MFSSDQKPSPRREVQLQGPRPTPLKVSKDSHRIRKPPAGPSHQPPPPPPLPRAPVIIYAVSPKVIHTTPGDFMSLVQRLTGPSPRSLQHPAAAAVAAVSLSPGPVSPAACLAAIEGSCPQSFPYKVPAAAVTAARDPDYDVVLAEQLGMDIAATLDMASLPGILSPLPTALPAISPGFFSPPPELGSMAFLNEMSPVFRGSSAEGPPFLPSPGTLLFTPTLPSPGALWDILGQL